ncbi:MAG: septation regulator SpoVG [Oscillospiraceae bacterium]|nr:septation regulator SpoVG [Oscillospiraceae bacterium]
MLEISDIRVRKIIHEGRLRAVVSLTIDNAVAVHDIKLVQGDERMFVAMPSRRDESGTFRDIIHPINPEARQQIESQILKAYDEHLAAEEATMAMIGETTEDSIQKETILSDF